MGFLARLFGRPGRPEPSGQSGAPAPRAEGSSLLLTDPEIEAWLRGGTASVAGTAVTPQAAMQTATAYRCTRLICGAIGTMAFHVKRRRPDGTRIDLDDHPARILMTRRPNAWQTPAEFRKFMQLSLLNRGNGYALKVMSRGRVTDLVPLHPDRMTVEQGRDFALTYVYQRRTGGVARFAQEEIFHLRGPSEDTVTGLSVIAAAAQTLGLHGAVRDHAATLFRNGTAAGGILRHPRTLGPEAVRRLRASLEEFRGSGSQRSYRDLVLEEGMTYERIGMTAVDAQLLQVMEATAYDICTFYGVPPHLAGLTTKTTSWGSGIEQQGIGFVSYTLDDYMTLWQQTVERDLFTAADHEAGVYAKFNPASLIRGDIKTRYAAYLMGRNGGWLSVNDIRRLEDMDGIGPAGDRYLEPLNMTNPAEAGDSDGQDT